MSFAQISCHAVDLAVSVKFSVCMYVCFSVCVCLFLYMSFCLSVCVCVCAEVGMSYSVYLLVMSTSSSCSNTHRTLVAHNSSQLRRYCMTNIYCLSVRVYLSVYLCVIISVSL